MAPSSRSLNWEALPRCTASRPKQIAIGSDQCVAFTTENGDGFVWETESKNWKALPGNLDCIGIGSDGEMWSTDADCGAINRWNKEQQLWERMPGIAKSISVGNASNVVCVDQEGTGLQWDGNAWQVLHSNISCLSMGNDGAVWACRSDGCIFSRNKKSGVDGSGEWVQLTGTAVAVGVGCRDVVYCMSESGLLYKWVNETWRVHDGKYRHFAAAADGCVACIDDRGRLLRYIPPSAPLPPKPVGVLESIQRHLFLTWADLSETQANRILNAGDRHTRRNYFVTFLKLHSAYPDAKQGNVNNGNERRRAIFADLCELIYQMCADNTFAAEQFSTLLSILRTIHLVACELPGSPPSASAGFALFQELLLKHSVARPPFSIAVFSYAQIKAATDFAVATYFRHYQMYQYVFGTRHHLKLDVSYSYAPHIDPVMFCELSQAINPEANVVAQARPLSALALQFPRRPSSGEGSEGGDAAGQIAAGGGGGGEVKAEKAAPSGEKEVKRSTSAEKRGTSASKEKKEKAAQTEKERLEKEAALAEEERKAKELPPLDLSTSFVPLKLPVCFFSCLWVLLSPAVLSMLSLASSWCLLLISCLFFFSCSSFLGRQVLKSTSQQVAFENAFNAQFAKLQLQMTAKLAEQEALFSAQLHDLEQKYEAGNKKKKNRT